MREKISIINLEKYSEDFYSFAAMEKYAFIRKTPRGKWKIVSRKGKSLGEYDTKEEAKIRLQQIEFFKHKKASKEELPTESYSAIVRFLNKNYSEETVSKFQKLFKENFDRLYLAGNEEPEEEALEIAISSVGKFKKNANAIEMGNPEFAGKRLADLVKFLLRRVPEEGAKRSKALQSAKKKLYMINEYDLAGKETPPNSAIGNAVSIVKTILLENNPTYIRNVINIMVKYI